MENKKMIIEILVGIPCSGKSTYTTKQVYLDFSNDIFSIESISRDSIREDYRYFNQPYFLSKENEKKVTEVFNQQLLFILRNKYTNKVILDNTHVKEAYIDAIIREWGDECDIKIKFFDISLLKSFYRNIIRKHRTGKFIPFKVIYNMYKSYKKINRKKYEKYISM